MAADDDIVVDEAIRIPRSELTFQFSRSGGPGGQNVNKVNSRVQMRWNVEMSASLPDDVRQRLTSHNRRRIKADGVLILTSQRYRDQPRNIEDCVEKLRELVAAAAVAPRVAVRANRLPAPAAAVSQLKKSVPSENRAAARRGSITTDLDLPVHFAG